MLVYRIVFSSVLRWHVLTDFNFSNLKVFFKLNVFFDIWLKLNKKIC